MSVRVITTMLVLIGIFAMGMLLTVSIFDPFVGAVGTYNMGGMGTIVDQIHEVAVKWLAPIGIGTVLVWAVLRILREERQTVR